MHDRAYAYLEVKSFDAEARTIEGIATTPTPDRSGDVMDPEGAVFTLPLPLLWQHNQAQPVGEVLEARVTPDGILIKARLAQLVDPGPLKARLDDAWQHLKAGLVRGLSIGWKPITAVARTGGGHHVSRWHWAELSLVTIPLNQTATILSIKSAALGPNLSGASDPLPVVRLKEARAMMNTYSEQIDAHKTKRAAVVSEMTELMSSAEANGTTLDGEQSKRYDGWALEVKALDAHLGRLAQLETLNAAAAKPIDPKPPTATPPIVQVKSLVPKGTSFVRYTCAQLVCNGNKHEAAEYAKRWDDSTPEVSLALKAAVAPGTTTDATWAMPLVNQNISNDFLELLRPATILGKISGFRNVPFNTKVPAQTGGGTYGWVGEQKPKPVSKLAFSSEALTISKAAGIIVLTEELVRLSNPSAEALVRADMIAGIAQFLDAQFIDPAVAAVAGVNPASITNGAPTQAATANPAADIMALIGHFAAANISVAGVHIILSPTNALSLSFRTNLDGSPMFPGVGLDGGSYRGLTFVTSMAAQALVIALQPQLVLLADEGGVNIDASREASLQMDSAPMSPSDATTVLVSLWQNNCVGLRAERFINWKRANANAVKYLTAANYPAPTGTLASGAMASAPVAEEPPPLRNGKRAE
jgi:HK97 family phage major capsid protein/HK97 family phage prohead protease